MPPFVVFSLPRSRSAWMSAFLSTPSALVAHDLGPRLGTPGELVWRLRNEFAGTCETGAAFAWPLIRQLLPDVVFAVIRRDPADVTRSLERFGLVGYGEEMAARDRLLDEIAAQPGALSVDFNRLAEQGECSRIYDHCRGGAMPVGWWRHMDALNIQVDMARELRFLAENHGRIEAFKSTVRGMIDA